MKKIIFTLLCVVCSLSVLAQDYERQFLLAGASFAVPENGWFELVCEAFKAKPLNRAVSGESIKDTALDMYDGSLYTTDELREISAFIIMHVHDQNVMYTSGIKENYEDYTRTEVQSSYHVAYDYVIKKYKADCESINKTDTIILCTHWHDSRTDYNASIRLFAQKWNLPLIKWDDNIGFTKNVLDEDGKQPSLKYAKDTQKQSNNVTYGWHPLHGKRQYIQQKMAWICMEELEKLFGPTLVSATISEKSKIIMQDEDAYAIFSFMGIPPWNFTYSVNGENVTLENITETPLVAKIDVNAVESAILPVSVSNNSVEEGTVSGETNIYVTDRNFQTIFDTYVHQFNKTTSYVSDTCFQIKANLTIQPASTHARESYVSFNIEDINPDEDERIIVRAYYYDCVYPNSVIKETHFIEIAGNTNTYNTMTWSTKPTNFTDIGEIAIEPGELESYIDWDVTDWVKEQAEAGQTNVTFRLRLGETNASGLLYFYSSESTSENKPQLLVYAPGEVTSLPENNETFFTVFPNPAVNNIHINSPEAIDELCVSSVLGKQHHYNANITSGSYSLNVSAYPAGCYLVSVKSGSKQKTEKIIIQ